MKNTSYIKLYEVNSIPLKEVSEVATGDIVYTSTGNCFECVGRGEEGSAVYEEVHGSELVDGETLEGLEDNKQLLELFWKLSNRRLNKVKHGSYTEGR